MIRHAFPSLRTTVIAPLAMQAARAWNAGKGAR